MASAQSTTTLEAESLAMPRIARALRHQDFRYFWAGNFLSNIGTWMQNVAQGWLVLQLASSNPSFWLGVVGFAAASPMLVFALLGGVIADHVSKRRLIISTQLVMMASAFTMAALSFFGVITLGQLVALVLVTGIASSLNTPAYQAIVPRLVPREEIVNAIGLNSAQFNMSRVIGPTVGGFAMAAFGAAGNFLLNGLSFLSVIVAFRHIRFEDTLYTGEWKLWERLLEGFRYVRARQEMTTLIMLVSTASFLGVPYLTFVPLFARNILGLDERGLGLLMACSGLGAFCAAATVAYLGKLRRPGKFTFYTGVAFFCAIVAFSLSREFWLTGVVQFIAGYSMILMVATINTFLQHLAADEMRARVMSIYATAYLGLPPLGSLLAGLLSRLWPVPYVLAGMAVAALVLFTAIYSLRPEFRRLD